MFEHTLAGSLPAERSSRFGPVSMALVLHAGALLAIVGVSLLTLRPVHGPEIRMIFYPMPRPPDIEPMPAVQTPAPRAGGSSQNRPAPAQPVVPSPPPESVPDVGPVLDPVATAAIANAPLDGNGSSSSIGLPGDGDGTGTGTGIGDGPDETGDGPGDGHGTGPISLGPGVAAPRLIVKVQPDYPSIARRSRMEGEVMLRAVVGPDGLVTSVTVVRSTSPLFNQSAVEAVRKWRYTPPTQDGRPVSVWLDVAVRFNLR